MEYQSFKISSIILTTLLISSCKTTFAPPITGTSVKSSESVEENISYKKIEIQREDGAYQYLHLVKVNNPKKVKLLVRGQKTFIQNRAVSPTDFSKSNDMKVVMNASFFDGNYTPLGLTVSDGLAWDNTIAFSYRSAGTFFCNKNNDCNIDYESEIDSNSPIYNAVSGYPVILINGSKANFSSEDRHPRSIIGTDSDGSIYFAVADGRSYDVFGGFKKIIGFTYTELSEILLEQGLTDALNLDGGGSSNLILDGKRVSMRKITDPSKNSEEILNERKVPVVIGIK